MILKFYFLSSLFSKKSKMWYKYWASDSYICWDVLYILFPKVNEVKTTLKNIIVVKTKLSLGRPVV